MEEKALHDTAFERGGHVRGEQRDELVEAVGSVEAGQVVRVDAEAWEKGGEEGDGVGKGGRLLGFVLDLAVDGLHEAGVEEQFDTFFDFLAYVVFCLEDCFEEVLLPWFEEVACCIGGTVESFDEVFFSFVSKVY